MATYCSIPINLRPIRGIKKTDCGWNCRNTEADNAVKPHVSMTGMVGHEEDHVDIDCHGE